MFGEILSYGCVTTSAIVTWAGLNRTAGKGAISAMLSRGCCLIVTTLLKRTRTRQNTSKDQARAFRHRYVFSPKKNGKKEVKTVVPSPLTRNFMARPAGKNSGSQRYVSLPQVTKLTSWGMRVNGLPSDGSCHLGVLRQILILLFCFLLSASIAIAQT